jgi:hypothetical protein
LLKGGLSPHNLLSSRADSGVDLNSPQSLWPMTPLKARKLAPSLHQTSPIPAETTTRVRLGWKETTLGLVQRGSHTPTPQRSMEGAARAICSPLLLSDTASQPKTASAKTWDRIEGSTLCWSSLASINPFTKLQ